ncbi:DUF998 domain-containing protein [Nonomuraea sediminis]|uniref:DUF998 domain-containing protein n=1 Tax=Nonomuraea sediminis TaxID=2835864 RepID=UPI002029E643|nr:DUF998 domain-containing protein [Nonomuraea sediminis]
MTTKKLLVWGVVAGPFYVVLSLTQALTRKGFDLARHEWSLLANGDLGWIQTGNLALTGAMVVAFAIGVRRAWAATWGPAFLGAYGVGMVAAGIFVADPRLGFPMGTPEGSLSWHGVLHMVTGGIGFLSLVAACLVVARRFGRGGRRGWTVFSLVTGIAFLAGFAGIASGSGSVALNLGFTAAILLAWTWMSALALHLYRTR